MELTKEAKEMVGNSYLFSGNFLDKIDREEDTYAVLKVKTSDWKIKKENGDVYSTFKCLVKNNKMEKAKWTKALPMEKIN